MAAIFGRGKFFWKIAKIASLDTLWVENFDEIALSRTVKEIEANLCFAIFDEIALSRTVKEIEANLCFAIFGKNSKIQNGPPFLGRGKFFENCKYYIP